MLGLCRLWLIAAFAVAVSSFSDVAQGKRKRKHHHRRHHHHHHHPEHGHQNASVMGGKHVNASDLGGRPAAANTSGNASRQHGLLDVFHPKSSHGVAAVHAAAHAALHRGHAARLTAHDDHMQMERGPVAPTQYAKGLRWKSASSASKNLNLDNRSLSSSESTVALAHTAVRVDASAGDAKHPHASLRQPPAPSANEETGHKASQASAGQKGQLLVGGPLPLDFEDRFVEGVAKAARVPEEAVQVLSVSPDKSAEGGNIDTVVFAAPEGAVELVEDEASDPDSELANGPLHIFLVDRSAGASEVGEASEGSQAAAAEVDADGQHGATEAEEEEAHTAGHAGGDSMFDVDGDMPYGDLEPFGREDTAEELTGSSIRESDQMVDQLERAEVAEEKRAVFRALTRLRGAAITSFDGIARSQTGNIDEYNKRNTWRGTHPLHHLADEESDVNKWAFPTDSDC